MMLGDLPGASFSLILQASSRSFQIVTGRKCRAAPRFSPTGFAPRRFVGDLFET